MSKHHYNKESSSSSIFQKTPKKAQKPSNRCNGNQGYPSKSKMTKNSPLVDYDSDFDHHDRNYPTIDDTPSVEDSDDFNHNCREEEEEDDDGNTMEYDTNSATPDFLDE